MQGIASLSASPAAVFALLQHRLLCRYDMQSTAGLHPSRGERSEVDLPAFLPGKGFVPRFAELCLQRLILLLPASTARA